MFNGWLLKKKGIEKAVRWLVTVCWMAKDERVMMVKRREMCDLRRDWAGSVGQDGREKGETNYQEQLE